MSLPKVGQKMRNTRGDLYHVRGTVDGYTVLRTWSKRKQYWVYLIENRYAVSGKHALYRVVSS